MRPGKPSLIGLAASFLVVAAGCTPNPGVPVAPKAGRKPAAASARPSVAPVATGALAKAIAGLPTRLAADGDVALVATRLTGKVKLLSNNGGGIISDNGGGIISNNSGAIISDNGGGIISDNGGGVVANNGAGVVANNGAGYRLAQAKAPAEFGLADAVITVHDAAGRVLLDADGKPVTATTDQRGGYVLAGDLPAENLILKIKLWKGGTLQAMVTRDAGKDAALDLDTASSIGATYVLTQFVKGDQKTFDKLPGSEAARLHRTLDEAQALVTAAPTYEDADLVALGDKLRGEAPAVDKTLADIKAILLGQANLGAGRRADTVPLQNPRVVAAAADGTVYVLESTFGRIRAIAPDGTITTFADSVRGKVKQNFAHADDMIVGPDGALYVSTPTDGRVWRIRPATGEVEVIAGNGAEGRATPGARATETSLKAERLAFGPDGTLYIGEGAPDLAERPRVFALAPDGTLEVMFHGKYAGGGIRGLAVLPDGFGYLETVETDADFHDHLRRRRADGSEEELSSPDTNPWMAGGRDGTLYVVRPWDHVVAAHHPDGTTTLVAGPGSLAPASAALKTPYRLGVGPDDALYVIDEATNIVYRLGPDRRTWTVVAGTDGVVTAEGDVTAVALNGPSDVAIAPDGAMIVSENNAGLIKRFDGEAFSTLAGGMSFKEAAIDPTRPGEGIPALGSCLANPRGLAFAGADLLIMDAGTRRIRALAPDGTIRTKVGVPGLVVVDGVATEGATTTLAPGVPQAAGRHLAAGSYVTMGPDGLPYWTGGVANQVFRLRPDGQVEAVSGFMAGGAETVLGALIELPDGTPAAEWKPAYPSGLAFDKAGNLYVAELVAQQVRKISGLATGNPTVSTFAGLSAARMVATTPTGTGDGGPATEAPLIGPVALCFDAAGNLYVGEAGTRSVSQLTSALGDVPLPPGVQQVDARVRKITPAGVITTVAGPGGTFFTDPTAEDALLLPTGLAVDAQGRLYISDAGSNLVRILPAGRF